MRQQLTNAQGRTHKWVAHKYASIRPKSWSNSCAHFKQLLDRKVARIVVIIEMGSGARLSKDSFASRMNSSTASQCSSIASAMAFEVVACWLAIRVFPLVSRVCLLPYSPKRTEIDRFSFQNGKTVVFAVRNCLFVVVSFPLLS